MVPNFLFERPFWHAEIAKILKLFHTNAWFFWRHHSEVIKIAAAIQQKKIENSYWINLYLKAVANNPWTPNFA